MTDSASDTDLVTLAQAGDRRAMDTLLRRHYDRIYAVCRQITGHDADAADAAQHALMSIVRALPRFDGRAAFTTWAHRIATNASLDELRRRKRRPAESIDIDDQPVHLDDHRAAASFSRVVDKLALDQALASVPDDFRIPLVMRDVADLDYSEIADALGIPIGTVKSRIARGRAALTASYLAASEVPPPGGNRAGPDERPTAAP